MVSVQKVSFRGDLLKQMNSPAKVATSPQQVNSTVQTYSEPMATFNQNQKNEKVSFAGNNAIAIASAVVSTVALGLGVTVALLPKKTPVL